MDEVASARARRAVRRLGELLVQVEGGVHDLTPERVESVSAHIRRVLDGHAGRGAARREAPDRRASG